MKTRVTKIEEPAFPPGALHLGAWGWVIDRPEELIIRTNIPMKDFMEQIADLYSGILGPGELVFALFDTQGKPSAPQFKNAFDYTGHVVFIPDQEG